MEYNVNKLVANVRAGAMMLDSTVPAWHTKIDTKKLILCSNGKCLLGQLFGKFEKGLEKLQITGLAQAFGFDLKPWKSREPLRSAERRNIAWLVLDAAWKREIFLRKLGDRVEAGMKLLDEKLPGWEHDIDLERLDIAMPDDCVLGQLAGHHFEFINFTSRLLGIDVLSGAGISYGFDIDVGVRYPYKFATTIWKERIAARHTATKEACKAQC